MLDINPLLMLITLVVFFVMLYQLNERLYKPLLRFMDDRDATIAKDMEMASNLSDNTSDLTAEANANIDEAKNAAAKLRQETIAKGKSEAATMIEARQVELEKSHQTFLVKLEKEKESLQSALLSQMPLIKESLKAKFSQL